MADTKPTRWIWGPMSESVLTETGELVADLSAREDGERAQEADGRLLAAAPELRAALEDAADHLEGLHGLKTTTGEIRVSGHVNRYRRLLARLGGQS